MSSRLLSLRAIERIFHDSYDKIGLICQTKGGWEGWMKCEMIYLLRDYKVRRELDKYHNPDPEKKDLRCDLFFQKPDILIVEMKCLGLGPVQGQEGILGGVPGAVDTFMKKVVKKDKDNIATLKGDPQGMAVVIIPKFWGDSVTEFCERELSAMGFSPVIGMVVGTKFTVYTYG